MKKKVTFKQDYKKWKKGDTYELHYQIASKYIGSGIAKAYTKPKKKKEDK